MKYIVVGKLANSEQVSLPSGINICDLVWETGTKTFSTMEEAQRYARHKNAECSALDELTMVEESVLKEAVLRVIHSYGINEGNAGVSMVVNRFVNEFQEIVSKYRTKRFKEFLIVRLEDYEAKGL